MQKLSCMCVCACSVRLYVMFFSIMLYQNECDVSISQAVNFLSFAGLDCVLNSVHRIQMASCYTRARLTL